LGKQVHQQQLLKARPEKVWVLFPAFTIKEITTDDYPQFYDWEFDEKGNEIWINGFEIRPRLIRIKETY